MAPAFGVVLILTAIVGRVAGDGVDVDLNEQYPDRDAYDIGPREALSKLERGFESRLAKFANKYGENGLGVPGQHWLSMRHHAREKADLESRDEDKALSAIIRAEKLLAMNKRPLGGRHHGTVGSKREIRTKHIARLNRVTPIEKDGLSDLMQKCKAWVRAYCNDLFLTFFLTILHRTQ